MRITKYVIEKYSGEKHTLEISKQGDLYRVIVDGDISDMKYLSYEELMSELEQPTF